MVVELVEVRDGPVEEDEIAEVMRLLCSPTTHQRLKGYTILLQLQMRTAKELGSSVASKADAAKGGHRAQRLPAYLRSRLPELLRQLQADLMSSGTDIALNAMKCTAFFLHNQGFLASIPEAELAATLKTVTQVVITSDDKAVCNSAVWCITQQNLPHSVLAPLHPYILRSLLHALNNPMGSASIVSEACKAIQRLVHVLSAEMRSSSAQWVLPLWRRFLWGHRKEVEHVEAALGAAVREGTILPPIPAVSKAMAEEARGRSFARLESMAKTGEPAQHMLPAVHAWAWMVRLLGPCLTEKGNQLVNLLLRIPESAFGCGDNSVRVATQMAWQALIDTLVASSAHAAIAEASKSSLPSLPAAHGGARHGMSRSGIAPVRSPGGRFERSRAPMVGPPSSKRLTLLMAPLLNSVSSDADHMVRGAALHTWCHLLGSLGPWSSSQGVFGATGKPMLELVFRQGPGMDSDKIPAWGGCIRLFEGLLAANVPRVAGAGAGAGGGDRKRVEGAGPTRGDPLLLGRAEEAREHEDGAGGKSVALVSFGGNGKWEVALSSSSAFPGAGAAGEGDTAGSKAVEWAPWQLEQLQDLLPLVAMVVQHAAADTGSSEEQPEGQGVKASVLREKSGLANRVQGQEGPRSLEGSNSKGEARGEAGALQRGGAVTTLAPDRAEDIFSGTGALGAHAGSTSDSPAAAALRLWRLLVAGVAAQGRAAARPTPQHVAAVHTLLEFASALCGLREGVAPPLRRALRALAQGQEVHSRREVEAALRRQMDCCWGFLVQLVQVLGPQVLGSTTYKCPVSPAAAAAGPPSGPGAAAARPARKITPAAYLTGMWLDMNICLSPPGGEGLAMSSSWWEAARMQERLEFLLAAGVPRVSAGDPSAHLKSVLLLLDSFVSPAFTASPVLNLEPHDCLGLLAEGQGQASLATAGHRPATPGAGAQGAGRVLQGALGLWMLLLPRLQARLEELHDAPPKAVDAKAVEAARTLAAAALLYPLHLLGSSIVSLQGSKGTTTQQHGPGDSQALKGACTLVSFELAAHALAAASGFLVAVHRTECTRSPQAHNAFLAAAFQSFQALLPAPAMASTSRADQGQSSRHAGARALGGVWWRVAVELACAAAEAAVTSAAPAPASTPAVGGVNRQRRRSSTGHSASSPGGGAGDLLDRRSAAALSDQASGKLAEVDDPNRLRPILLTINSLLVECCKHMAEDAADEQAASAAARLLGSLSSLAARVSSSGDSVLLLRASSPGLRRLLAVRGPETTGSTDASGAAGTVVKALESAWQALLDLMERTLPASAWESPALLSSVAGCLEDALSHPRAAISQPSLRFWDSTFGVAVAAAQAAPVPMAPKVVPPVSKRASPMGSRHAPASLAGHRASAASPGARHLASAASPGGRHLASSPAGARRGRESSTPSPKSAGLKVPEQLTRSVEAARSRAAAHSSEDKAEGGGDAPLECPPCKLEEAFSVAVVGAPAAAGTVVDAPAAPAAPATQATKPTCATGEGASSASTESGPAEMEGVEHESQRVPSATGEAGANAQVPQQSTHEAQGAPLAVHEEGTSHTVGVPGVPGQAADAPMADLSAVQVAVPPEQQAPAAAEPEQPPPSAAAAAAGAEQAETSERSEGFSAMPLDTVEQAAGAPALPSPSRPGGAGSMPSPARQGAPTARQPSPFRTTPTGKPRKLSSVSNRLSRLLSGSPDSRNSTAAGAGAGVPGYMKPASPSRPGSRGGAPSASPFRPASPAAGARFGAAASRGTSGAQGSTSAAPSRGTSPARGAKSPVKPLPSPPRRTSAAVAAEPRPAVVRSNSGEAPGAEPRAPAAAPSYTPRTLSHSFSAEMPLGAALEPPSGGFEAEEILAALGKSMDMSQVLPGAPGAAAATPPPPAASSAEAIPTVPPMSSRTAPSPHRPSASRLRSLASGFKNLLVSSQPPAGATARAPSPARHSPYGHVGAAPAQARAPSPRTGIGRAASPAPTPAQGPPAAAPGAASSPASRSTSGPISLASRGRRPSPARHVAAPAGNEAATGAAAGASAAPGAVTGPLANEDTVVTAGQQAPEAVQGPPLVSQRSGLFSLRTRGGEGSRVGGSSFGRRDVERGREGAAAARPASPAFRGGPLKVPWNGLHEVEGGAAILQAEPAPCCMPSACVDQWVGAASHALHTLGSGLFDTQLPGGRAPRSEDLQGLAQQGERGTTGLNAENTGVAVGMKRKGSGSWAGPELVLAEAGAEAPVLSSIMPWSRKASRTGPENRPASPLASSMQQRERLAAELLRFPSVATGGGSNSPSNGAAGTCAAEQGASPTGGQGSSTDEEDQGEEDEEESEEVEEEDDDEEDEEEEEEEGQREDEELAWPEVPPAQNPSLMDVLLGGEEVGAMEEREMGMQGMGKQAVMGEEQGWEGVDTGSPSSCSDDSDSDAGADLRAAVREVVGYTGLSRLVDMLLGTPELQEMSTRDLMKAQRKLLALSGEIAALLERKTDGARGG